MNKLYFVLAICCSFQASSQNEEALVIADSLYSLGNFKEAITLYESIPKSHLKIASSYQSLGNVGRALTYYKTALKEQPNATIAQFRYGTLLLHAGYSKKADSIFKLLEAAHPTNPNFPYHLGLVKEQRNDSTAILDFERALQLDNTYQNALYKIAKHHIEKRSFELARTLIDQGLKEDPNGIRFLNLDALENFYSEKYHDALASYNKLIEFNQSNAQIHQNMAMSFANTNQFQKAIDQYTLLINGFDATVAKWHFGLANAYRALQYYEKAQRHYEIAIVLKNISAEAEYFALAQLFGKQKQYKKQMEMLQKVIEENPQSHEGHYFLAAATDNYLEDKNLVIPYYEKYLKRFGETGRFSEYAKQRIKDLKTELHFGKD